MKHRHIALALGVFTLLLTTLAARPATDDLVPVIRNMPELLGIGISEGSAIIVTGDRFEVMGKWKVAVHDNTRLYKPWEKPYFVLSAGDVYNMKSRRIEKLGTGARDSGLPGLSSES